MYSLNHSPSSFDAQKINTFKKEQGELGPSPQALAQGNHKVIAHYTAQHTVTFDDQPNTPERYQLTLNISTQTVYYADAENESIFLREGCQVTQGTLLTFYDLFRQKYMRIILTPNWI